MQNLGLTGMSIEYETRRGSRLCIKPIHSKPKAVWFGIRRLGIRSLEDTLVYHPTTDKFEGAEESWSVAKHWSFVLD